MLERTIGDQLNAPYGRNKVAGIQLIHTYFSDSRARRTIMITKRKRPTVIHEYESNTYFPSRNGEKWLRT